MDYPPSDPRKEHYLGIWKEMLGAFLGWPEARVIRWAEAAWGEWIGDLEEVFYEQPPVYWALPALIPASLKVRLNPNEMDELLGRLLIAFDDEHELDFPSGTDWSAYRRKVQRVLRSYGEKLPGD